jgi:hypothetical protein
MAFADVAFADMDSLRVESLRVESLRVESLRVESRASSRGSRCGVATAMALLFGRTGG